MATAHGLVLTERLVTVRTTEARARVLTTPPPGTPAIPIVWINGIGTPATGLATLAGRFPGAQHVLVDLPGHSLAPPFLWTGSPLRALAVQIVTAVLDDLGIARAHIVGSSLGGQFALWAAADAPGRIAGAVVLGAPGTAVGGITPTASMRATASGGRGRLAEVLMRCPSPRPVARAALAEAIGDATARALAADIVDLHRLPLRLPGRAASYRALLRRLIHHGVVLPENVLGHADLTVIDRPILFAWGRRDTFLAPSRRIRDVVGAMPRARLVVVEGGHNPWFDDLDHCTDLLGSFLAESDTPITARNQPHA